MIPRHLTAPARTCSPTRPACPLHRTGPGPSQPSTQPCATGCPASLPHPPAGWLAGWLVGAYVRPADPRRPAPVRRHAASSKRVAGAGTADPPPRPLRRRRCRSHAPAGRPHRRRTQQRLGASSSAPTAAGSRRSAWARLARRPHRPSGRTAGKATCASFRRRSRRGRCTYLGSSAGTQARPAPEHRSSSGRSWSGQGGAAHVAACPP